MTAPGTRMLLISPHTADPPRGGRAMLSRLHRECLADLLQERLVVHELPPGGTGAIDRASALAGFIDGVSPRSIAAVLARIDASTGRVFLNGSNLGRLARAIKRRHPGVEVLTFFHNVEARFFWGSLKARRTPHALAVLAANAVAERLAVAYSDRLLCLSRRDADDLVAIYRRDRPVELLPMAVDDRRTGSPSRDDRVPDGEFLLFVGGAFFANRAGIAWYARTVAPRLAIRTLVVGNGMENDRAELEAHGNIAVIGQADSLEPFYRDARAVVAPIFDGSGMKTKVAEALMFGKRVLGTTEAFSGYGAVADMAGWRCDDADAFVDASRAAAAAPRYDPALRTLYERLYSPAAATRRLAEILGEPSPEKGRRAC